MRTRDEWTGQRAPAAAPDAGGLSRGWAGDGTATPRRIRADRLMRFYYGTLYYLSWFAFGSVGLALNLICLVLLLTPRRERLGPPMRRTIRFLVDFWFKGMHATGLMRVDWRGFDRTLPACCVIVANHPTLIDAILIMARVPDLTCIFKPSLMRNPAIGPAAILAGYVSAAGGVELIREAAEVVRNGRPLLVFPEGTRTAPGTVLGPLKAGFALIAQQAGAPIAYVRIRATAGLTARGRPWWKLPGTLPIVVEAEVNRCWSTEEQGSAPVMTEALREHILESLKT